MAAPILWAPGIFWLFRLENPQPIKFLLAGVGFLGFFRRGGDGIANFILMGAGKFLIFEISRTFRLGACKGWFPKGWFRQMFPCTEVSSKKSLLQCYPGRTEL